MVENIVNILGIDLFMPVFSFLFVTLITYLILQKTNVLGGSNFVSALVSFIVAIIFMSFSSLELYVRTIIPWFVVLAVIAFLVLLMAGFVKGDLKDIMTSKVGRVFGIILIGIFLIAAIKVFNPVFHPDLVITSSDQAPGVVHQIKEFFSSTKIAGSVLLLIIAAIVAKVITKK